MTMRTWIARSAWTALLLTLVHGVLGAVLAADSQVSGTLVWGVAANVVTALLVTFLAARLNVGGVPRAGVLFLVVFGIPANNFVDLLFFDLDIGRTMLLRLYVFNLVVGAVLAAFVGWQAGAPAPSDRRRALGPAALAGRMAIGSLAYVIVYFVAGFLAFPFLADFYAGRAMPGLGELALVAVFRGSVFTTIAAAIVAWTAMSLRHVALSVGLTLSVLGGVVPLMAPNAFMPTSVRLVHLVEVGVSNVLFGLFVGWLFSRVRDAAASAPAVPA